MMHGMVVYKTDRVMKMTFKTEHTQATKEALVDISATSHAAATNDLKDVFYSYTESILTRLTFKSTLNGLFVRNLERSNQALEFMGAFTHNVLNSKTFTNTLAKFAKEQIDNTVDEQRLNDKREAHLRKKRPHPAAPPSQSNTLSGKSPQALACRKLEHTHSHKQKA